MDWLDTSEFVSVTGSTESQVLDPVDLHGGVDGTRAAESRIDQRAWFPWAMALGAALLVLLAPLPSPEAAAELCHNGIRTIGGDVGYVLNCDSRYFVGGALDPASLALTDHPYQSRPLYFLVPGIVGLSGNAAAVSATYTLMNVASLALAIHVVTRLVGRRHSRWGLLMLPLVMLSDVSKAFLWTPHTQCST